MKYGMRTPSPKKSFSSRTTGKVTRSVKKATNPLYGKKGVGMIKDPEKAIKNKVYHKTTVGISDIAKSSTKSSGKNNSSGTSTTYQTPQKSNGSCVGTCWKIFLWILFFPIMLTIWLWKTDKIEDKRVKIGLIAALWVVVFIYFGTNASSSSKGKDSSSASTEVTTEASTDEIAADMTAEDSSSKDQASEEASTSESTEAVEEVEELAHNGTARNEIANEFLAKYNAVADNKITADMVKTFSASTARISITFPDVWMTLNYPSTNDDRFWYDLRMYGEFEDMRKYYLDFCKALVPDADENTLNQYFDQMTSGSFEGSDNAQHNADVYGLKWCAVDGHPYSDYFMWLFMGSIEFTDK